MSAGPQAGIVIESYNDSYTGTWWAGCHISYSLDKLPSRPMPSFIYVIGNVYTFVFSKSHDLE